MNRGGKFYEDGEQRPSPTGGRLISAAPVMGPAAPSGTTARVVSRTHDLKCWPEPFEALREGRKTFEWRRDDRGYAVGDTLILREWDPTGYGRFTDYNRRVLAVEVTYILRGVFGMPEGFVVMGVKPTDGPTKPETGGAR